MVVVLKVIWVEDVGLGIDARIVLQGRYRDNDPLALLQHNVGPRQLVRNCAVSAEERGYREHPHAF